MPSVAGATVNEDNDVAAVPNAFIVDLTIVNDDVTRLCVHTVPPLSVA
jgi:hypothetical protein